MIPMQIIQYFKNIKGQTMTQTIEGLKDIVPDFILKLYHILGKTEYSDCISWSANGLEVMIRNPKKLEETVLPFFFRHKQITSFIRQLNMYKFSKINKITKQKGHMFFRNDNFKEGHMEGLKSIKRTRKEAQNKKNSDAGLLQKEEGSINKDQSVCSQLSRIPCHHHRSFLQIQQALQRISEKNPELSDEFNPIISICQNSLHEKQEPIISKAHSLSNLIMLDGIQSKHQNASIGEQDNLGVNLPFILPSVCSLSHLQA